MSAITFGIENSGMKELRQEHLRPFTKLRILDLNNNEIKTLEKDLFMFNTELQQITLHDNKITEVHLTAFDNLKKLKELNM
jgi:Leucine-rich repeat (LRR) protein